MPWGGVAGCSGHMLREDRQGTERHPSGCYSNSCYSLDWSTPSRIITVILTHNASPSTHAFHTSYNYRRGSSQWDA